MQPFAYEVFDSESALELNPEAVTLTPGTFCIHLLGLEKFKNTNLFPHLQNDAVLILLIRRLYTLAQFDLVSQNTLCYGINS